MKNRKFIGLLIILTMLLLTVGNAAAQEEAEQPMVSA